jgi:hypothetical protein
VRSLSQGTSEVQDSAVLSTTARASGLHNGRGRWQALGRGLTGGVPRGQGLIFVAVGNIATSAESPAKRRSSAATATTATLSTEGLEREFALPADVGRWKLVKEWAFEVVFSPTHKLTEGCAPVWGSEFTTKYATLQGGSAVIAPTPNVKLWDPVVVVVVLGVPPPFKPIIFSDLVGPSRTISNLVQRT